jgi:hypothetical protein
LISYFSVSSLSITVTGLALYAKELTANAAHDVRHTRTAKAVGGGKEIINAASLEELNDFVFNFCFGGFSHACRIQGSLTVSRGS